LGLIFETCLAAVIAYVTPLNKGLATRPVACSHFAIPAMSYFLIIFFWDEIRKTLLRNGIDRSVKGKVKYVGWTVRNSLW
jgi:hypothetical protein